MARWTARTLLTAASGLVATAGAVLVVSTACRGGRCSGAIDPVLRCWARAWLVPAGVRLRVEGIQHVRPRQVYVVVSNHQSNLDPMVHIVGLPLPLRFLAMKELFDVPLVGRAIRTIGMVEVDRGDPDMRGISEGTRRALSSGVSVVVFPEGQTSGDGSVGRFHTGAFAIAVANGVPILPVTLVGTRGIWAPGSNAIRRGVVRVVVGEPIPTAGLNARDAVRVRDDVRGWIVATYLRRDSARS